MANMHGDFIWYELLTSDADAAAVNAGGGSVIHGQMEIPGGDFSLNGIDPQGARFGLAGARA